MEVNWSFMKDAKTIADGALPSLPWESFPEVGEQFASYKLGKLIGKGGFGTVFQVQPDPQVEWFEAVKILHRSSGIDKQRFLKEISRLKEIRLPGIARIHATGEENGYLYYSMDYVDGESFDQWALSATNQTEIYRAFIELCNTVQNLHDQNFIHLDIKPQNVMVNSDAQVKLLDFGISTKKGTSAIKSADGLGAGTYEFSSPEQINGEDPAAHMDVYGLACLLYTVLAKAHPKIPRADVAAEFIPDKRLSREDILQLCSSAEVEDIRTYNFEVSPEIAEVLNKALSTSENRYQTVSEFRTSLINCGCLLPLFKIVFDGDLEQSAPFLPILEAMKLEFAKQIQIVAYTKKHSEKGDFEVSSKDDLQKAETGLRKALFEKLAKPDESAWSESPYKSLKSYSEKDAHLFFGRDKEIANLSSLIENLDTESAILTVLAPSGAGKSSFLKAGIIPVFKQSSGWNSVLLKPNKFLLSTLSSYINSYSEKEAGNLLIIIDQFEEALQTIEYYEDLKDLLGSALKTGNIKIILSLRNDFYQECISFLDSAQLAQNLYNLPKPGESSINRMIRMPALKAHLKFESDPQSGKSLIDILKEEAMQSPENLASLSFTLDEIFRGSPRGIMSYDVYQQLGGIHGALALRAENLMKNLSLDAPDDIFHKVFQKLVKVDENHVPRRLYADYSTLADNSDSQKMVNAFIDARLFTAENDEKKSKKIISVSHEALLQKVGGAGWSRVIDWLSEQKSNLVIHKRVRSAANEWEDNERERKFLFSNSDQMREIIALQQGRWEFSNLETEFIRESNSMIRRRYTYGLIAMGVILTISFFFFKEANLVENLTEERALIQQQVNNQKDRLMELEIQEEKVSAQLSARVDYSQLSRIASLQQNNSLPTPTAFNLLSEVREEGRNWMWGQLLYNAIPEHLILFGHKEEILSVEFSHDKESKYLLTSSWDDTAILWDSYTGVRLVTFNYSGTDKSSSDLEDARFSYDGYIALACNDGFVYVWNVDEAVRGAGEVQRIKMDHKKIRRIFFSRDNKYMICCGSEGSFSIWNWQNKKFNKPLASGQHSDDQKKRVYSAQLSGDGETLISTGWDGTVKKWHWKQGQLSEPKILGRHQSEIWWGEFSPDGSMYVSAGRDKEIKIWDVVKNRLIRSFGANEHKSDIRCATFSPDSKTLITTSRDKHVRLWNIADGFLMKKIKSHDNMVYCADFSSDGKRYASVSADKVLNVYQMDPKADQSQVLYHSDSVEDFDFLEGQLVSASRDGEIRFWNLSKGVMLSHFKHNEVSTAALKKIMFIDRKNIISADIKGGIKFWRFSENSWVEDISFKQRSSYLNSLVLSMDKKLMAASFKNGEILVWDMKQKKLLKVLKPEEFLDQDPCLTFTAENKLLCGTVGNIFQLDWLSDELTKVPVAHERKIFYIGRLNSVEEEIYVSCSRDSRVLVFDKNFHVLKEFTHGVRGDASYADLSKDSQFLVSSSSRDNNVFVWDLENELELLPLSGHEEPITKVKVISDSLILSSSKDGTIRLWRSMAWKEMRETIQEEGLQDVLQALIEAVKIYQLQRQ